MSSSRCPVVTGCRNCHQQRISRMYPRQASRELVLCDGGIQFPISFLRLTLTTGGLSLSFAPESICSNFASRRAAISLPVTIRLSMANAMPTTRHPPPFMRLLLLSVYVLVAYRNIVMASSVASNQVDQRVNTLVPIVPTEERGRKLVSRDAIRAVEDFIAGAAKELSPINRGYIDKMDPTVSSLIRISESEKAADTVDSGVWKLQMTSLFDELLLENQAVGRQHEIEVLGELVRQIVYFRAHPELPISASSIGANEFYQQRRIVLGLMPSLQAHLETIRVSPDDFFVMLNVDVNSDALFDDLTVLPRIEFLKKYTYWSNGGPFDFLLGKFPKPRNDFTIATRVLAAGAESNPSSVAGQLLAALIHDWKINHVNYKRQLLKLVPLPNDVHILSGPLQLWTKHFNWQTSNNNLYQTLLLHLLHPGTDLGSLHLLAAIPRNEKNELAVVNIVSAEWAKYFDVQSGATNDLRVSPLAMPVFKALCDYWKSHRVDANGVFSLLQSRNVKDQPGLSRAHSRMLLMFVANTEMPANLLSTLSSVDLVQLAELVAMEYDVDIQIASVLSNILYSQWAKEGLTSEKVFAFLKLPSPDEGLFQNHLLTVWFKYSPQLPVNDLSSLEMLLQMREYLKGLDKSENFESLLERSVLASDGMQQKVLFELLAVRWINEGVQVSDIPLLHHPYSPDMRLWFQQLVRRVGN